jgi:tetratricopeptide (TPR) repeat protein
MFVVSLVLLAFAATECQEALRPVAAALQGNEAAKAAAMLEALRSQCSAYGSFHELAGAASALAGNFSVAADEFQRALTLDPQLSNDPAVILWFAQALLETNQSARLTTFLSTVKRPLAPPLLFSLGTLFAKHGDYRQAILYLRQIPVHLADDAVYFNLGLAYSHLRQFDDARKCYFQAIDKQPAHVEAYFRVGLDFAASGDLRKSLPWLLRARNFAPARPDISYALTEQLLALQYLDTAEQIAAEALTANPQNPLLMAAHGDVLLARGKTAEAVDSYQSALAQEPRLPGALVGLARVAATQGNIVEARKKLQEALSIDSENPVANGELGSIEVDEGDWTDAYRHLAKAWAADQSNLTIALRLARALEHLNRADNALHLLQPLAPALRDSSAFHFELAQIYAQLRRTAEAQVERGQVARLQAKSENSLRFEDPKVYVH